ELIYLKSGSGPLPVRTDPILPPAAFGFSFARRVARTRSWTAAARMPRAVLAPGVVAISHNALLRDVAQRERRGVGFHHGETILARARRKDAPVPDTREVSRSLAALIVDSVALQVPYR